MKTTGFSILLIWFAIFAYAANTFAQDSPQSHLPEGATARLGKGGISGEIAYSPDGTRLAVASSIGIWLYDAQTDEALDLLTGHTSWVSSVSFSPDGNTLASGSDDGTVRLWDANTGRPLRTLTGHTSWVLSVSFSPDGNTLASASLDDTVRLWDANTGSSLRTLTGHTDSVYSVSFSPDGNTLASGSRDNTVRLWDATTGSPLRTLTGHTSGVESVSFSPDGNTLASGSDDATVLLWELAPAPAASEKIAEDVNTDGVVNIQDVVLVASNFGKTGENVADVNNDGVVNIVDLTLVAGGVRQRCRCTVSLGFRSGNRSDKRASPTVVASSTAGEPDRFGISAWDTGARTPPCYLDAETNRPPAELSESVQSGDVDTVSVGSTHGCYRIHLFSRGAAGSNTGIRASTCGSL